MFCSSCGNQVVEGLTYCNRCGVKLNVSVEKSDGKAPVTLTKILQHLLIWTGAITFCGLGMVMGLITILLDKNISPRTILLFALPFLFAVFCVSFMLIRQFSRVLEVYLKQQNKEIPQPSYPLQISGRSTAQIESPHEPFISVTENTTRTLDTILQERK